MEPDRLEDTVVGWLLEGDPAIRWQTLQRMFTLSAECFIDRKALSSNGVFVARATFCA